MGRFHVYTTLLALTVILTGCLGQESTDGTESGTTVVNEPTPGQPTNPLTSPERTICDPFNTQSATSQDRGIVANMVWLDDVMQPRNQSPIRTSVQQYIDDGHIVESTLYFDRLFVPTRRYDLPFVTQAGQPVLNEHDQPIYEYFGLRMESQFQLGQTDPAGNYQFAVLADDGAVLKIGNGSGGWQTLVNNDGVHATKMSCSTGVLNMQPGQKYPFQLDYYQGPRFHISLVVMFRPLPDGTNPDIPVSESLCGQQGNSLFFDYSQVPSVPKTPFYELLARGWKVLENENYYFPAQATNPCVTEEENLSISNFIVSNVTRYIDEFGVAKASVTLTWNTNVPASSQVEYRNISSGVTANSALSSAPVTSHSVTVTGLTTNTLYAFKGHSVTTGGQTAVSDERALRTPR